MRPLLSLALLVLPGTAALAQAPVPGGPAPRIGLASAFAEKDGKVLIEVFELREVMRMTVPWNPAAAAAVRSRVASQPGSPVALPARAPRRPPGARTAAGG